jgi:hypothetical protein
LELDVKNNKKRKLGKVLSQRVYEYLNIWIFEYINKIDLKGLC